MAEARRRLLAVVICAICALGLGPALAQAQEGFGTTSFEMSLSSYQAGAHADQTTSFSLNTSPLGDPIGQLNNVAVTLPAGLNGNPQAITRCPMSAFNSFSCPSTSQLGLLQVSLLPCRGATAPLVAEALAGETTLQVPRANDFCIEPYDPITIGSGPNAETATIINTEGVLELEAPLEHSHAAGEQVTQVSKGIPLPLPLFNLQPQPGHVATFGTMVLFAPILVNVDVADGGAGLKATISNASTLLPVSATAMTLWGVPSASSHDAYRCGELLAYPCNLPAGDPVPFMTNPTNCDGPLPSKLEISSYEAQSAEATTMLPALTGCENLQLDSSLSVAPVSTGRDTPTGYEVDLKVPQTNQTTGLATPDVKQVSVTLPQGTSLSPAMANGLQACTEAQFSAEECPNASKVGTAELTTPILGEKLNGGVYIGAPTAAEKYPLRVSLNAGRVAVRLYGQAEPDPVTGQVTTVFSNAPQLPFSDFKLNMFGGPQAVLANPTTCGLATSTSQIASYAGQLSTPSSSFTVGASEAPSCAAQPFAPTFSAGTTLPRAAAFSPFTMTVSHGEHEASLSSFSAQLPPGLLGLLKSVPLCPEPQASLGTCSAASEVGTATILAGSGAQPLPVTGPAYLTGPYGGAPFGLSVVVTAAAGPFNLGTAIVRSTIAIDPKDLHLTIVSDPFPQIMGGIPLRLRTVNVTFSRPSFMFNPTGCGAKAITATIFGLGGASAPVSSPFRVLGCEGLPFSPKLTAGTKAGGTLSGNGASLTVKIVSPQNSIGTMRTANIQLPTELRPRLATIQHACLTTTALPDPAKCPPDSLVGHATVVSPVTAAPLTGPVYLVAHGGTALPSLALLLKGGGISDNLTASLSITTHGPVKAVFGGLPDVPISSFEMKLPSGPHSMLGVTQNPCRRTLKMPYKLTDQAGVSVGGTAAILASGCHSGGGKPAKSSKHHGAKRAAGARGRSSHRSASGSDN